MTEQDQLNLKRNIYLAIMSSVGFEECCHKILKMNIREGQEIEVVKLIVECCGQERTFLQYFALTAKRLCNLNEVYRMRFEQLFGEIYQKIHQYEINKLRNTALLFSHLIYTESIEWSVFEVVTLTEEATTSSSRIFLKHLIQDICNNLGIGAAALKFQEPGLRSFLRGLFP